MAIKTRRKTRTSSTLTAAMLPWSQHPVADDERGQVSVRVRVIIVIHQRDWKGYFLVIIWIKIRIWAFSSFSLKIVVLATMKNSFLIPSRTYIQQRLDENSGKERLISRFFRVFFVNNIYLILHYVLRTAEYLWH